MPTIPLQAYPLFAPLPIPMVEHLWLRMRRIVTLSHGDGPDVQAVALAHLQEAVAHARTAIYTYMHPYVVARHMPAEASATNGQGRAMRYSTTWFLRTLAVHSPNKEPIPSQTLSLWHKRGLFRYQDYAIPDLDSAAALLIARLTDKRKRNWLPSLLLPEEPYWWCWRQDTPETAPVPCPIPLSEDIPPSALLWTPWTGASWNHDWLRLDQHMGAVRWAGIQQREDGRYWQVTKADLERWDPEIASYLPASPAYEQLVQNAAEFVLRRLSLARFSSAVQPGDEAS